MLVEGGCDTDDQEVSETNGMSRYRQERRPRLWLKRKWVLVQRRFSRIKKPAAKAWRALGFKKTDGITVESASNAGEPALWKGRVF